MGRRDLEPPAATDCEDAALFKLFCRLDLRTAAGVLATRKTTLRLSRLGDACTLPVNRSIHLQVRRLEGGVRP